MSKGPAVNINVRTNNSCVGACHHGKVEITADELGDVCNPVITMTNQGAVGGEMPGGIPGSEVPGGMPGGGRPDGGTPSGGMPDCMSSGRMLCDAGSGNRGPIIEEVD